MAVVAAVAFNASIASAQELELDRVIAVINDEVVLASELDRRMLGQTTTKNAADPRKAMLWAMIDERLMVQRALASQITISDADVETALAEIRNGNQLTQEQLLEELKKQGYTVDDYRRSLFRQLAVYRILNLEIRPKIAITDADVKALYDQRVAAGEKEPGKLEEVKEALRSELYTRRLDYERDRWLVQLRASAFIDIRLKEIR